MLGIMRDLTFLELFPIVGAVWLWGEQWANSVVTFWCDNQAVIHIVNSLTSRSQRVMTLVRTMVLCCLQFNIVFQGRHVPGVDNNIADALFRQQMDRFRALAPGAQVQPNVLPTEVCNLGRLRRKEP